MGYPIDSEKGKRIVEKLSGAINMSKTREIEGWVYLNSPTYIIERIPDNFSEMHGVARAKLIIEEPVKRISISESEFEMAWMEVVGTTCDGDLRDLKQKLFSEKSEG